MTESPHILIVGSGSVGKRHARNLIQLGCRISCMDPRKDRCREMKDEMQTEFEYTDFKTAISSYSFDGIVIGSPTAFHPEQAIIAIEAGIPVLLEKPVAINANDAYKIQNVLLNNKTPILLGYTWRWWPPLQQLKLLLKEGKIGSLRHVQFYMSAHLADWHPWEPYQSFFMSNKALGGGALLDESHWIDLMIWLLGMPERISASISKLSDLEIETDDNVDICCFYKGMNVTIHLDLYGRPHEKFIRLVGEKGTLTWSAEPNRIAFSSQWEQLWETEVFDYNRNDMFVSVAQEFLNVVNGAIPQTCTLTDGLRVMDLIEAIRESSKTGNTINIKSKNPEDGF
jgi:predicted dehydrogenase